MATFESWVGVALWKLSEMKKVRRAVATAPSKSRKLPDAAPESIVLALGDARALTLPLRMNTLKWLNQKSSSTSLSWRSDGR